MAKVSTTTSNQPASTFLAGDVHGKGDVLLGCQRRDQVVRLEDKAESVTPQPRERPILEVADVDPVDDHPPGGWRVQRGHAVHERRLSGT